MARKIHIDEICPILELAVRRSRHFGKYGERFDRRLYAELDSMVRIWMALSEQELLPCNPLEFRGIIKIRENTLEQGQWLYEDFP